MSPLQQRERGIKAIVLKVLTPRLGTVGVTVLNNICILEMATGRPRAGPENPGLRALRAETGLMIFHLRVLCALCANRWVVTGELCIVITQGRSHNLFTGAPKR